TTSAHRSPATPRTGVAARPTLAPSVNTNAATPISSVTFARVHRFSTSVPLPATRLPPPDGPTDPARGGHGITRPASPRRRRSDHLVGPTCPRGASWCKCTERSVHLHRTFRALAP